ncbi:MAG: hypothetical protein ACC653_12195 [Gammaproteobacteria bacterium]
MKSKTVITAIIGTIAGLALTMGTIAYATNFDHMGNNQTSSMMGQTYTQDTRDTMHGNTVKQGTHGDMHTQSTQNQHPVIGHHTANSQTTTSNSPCHADSGNKTGVTS